MNVSLSLHENVMNSWQWAIIYLWTIIFPTIDVFKVNTYLLDTVFTVIDLQ